MKTHRLGKVIAAGMAVFACSLSFVSLKSAASPPAGIAYLEDGALEKIVGTQESGGGGGGGNPMHCNKTVACFAAASAANTVTRCNSLDNNLGSCPQNRKVTQDCDPSRNTSQECVGGAGGDACKSQTLDNGVCNTRQYNQCYVTTSNKCSAQTSQVEGCGNKCTN